MLARLQQAFSKFIFCLRISRGTKTFFLLTSNSKRFNWFQKKHLATNLQKQATPVSYAINYRGVKRNIYLRTYAGDIRMFYEIFWEQVYRLPAVFPVVNGIIIDAGANIGMTSLYFSIFFPRAHIYCIEPVADNFRLLKMNLDREINSGKVHAVKAALYPGNGEVRINEDGWAYNASVGDAGRSSAEAITMDKFISNNKLEKIDLLKIDIEGAEKFIFLSDTSWLQKVNAILIEIHSVRVVAEIKSILLNAGFYWYPWNDAASSSSIYFASRIIMQVPGR
jgi:FkbM family methyltransferase